MTEGLSKNPYRARVVTVTAPGIADGFTWDTTQCTIKSKHRHAGKVGCKTLESKVLDFNSSIGKRWNRLHQRLERRFQVRLPYAKVYEDQKRGLLHIHAPMTGFPLFDPKSGKALTHEVVETIVRRCAMAEGFGYEVNVRSVLSDEKSDIFGAVNYCAKYLGKGSGEVRTRNKKTGEVQVGGVRYFTQSRDFGPTLKEIRARRLERYRLAQISECARTGEGVSAPGAEAFTGALGAESALDIFISEVTQGSVPDTFEV